MKEKMSKKKWIKTYSGIVKYFIPDKPESCYYKLNMSFWGPKENEKIRYITKNGNINEVTIKKFGTAKMGCRMPHKYSLFAEEQLRKIHSELLEYWELNRRK